MAYDLSRWTVYPMIITQAGVPSGVPMIVLVAPEIAAAINADLHAGGSRGGSSITSAFSRAFQHAVAVGALDGWWEDGSEPESVTISEVVTLTAENGPFRSAMFDKGIVIATPGERMDGCRVGEPIVIPSHQVNFRTR